MKSVSFCERIALKTLRESHTTWDSSIYTVLDIDYEIKEIVSYSIGKHLPPASLQ